MNSTRLNDLFRSSGYSIIRKLTAWLTSVICLLSLGIGLAQSAEQNETWQLVMRELPDGKKLYPPDVTGLSSHANGYKNLNVVWKTPDGKVASVSSISKVKVTDSEYSETMIFQRLVDPGHPQGMLLNVSGETKTVPIKREAGKVRYQLPFDPPFIVIDGDKSAATLEGVFVDHWEKIK